MLRIPLVAATILVGLIQLSCSSPLTGFTCVRDIDCATEAKTGICEANQRCSFADDSCDSGQRYGPVSGEDSDRCTTFVLDASPADSQVDAFPTTIGDAALTDARGTHDASTARVLTLVLVLGLNADGKLRVRVNGEPKGGCESENQSLVECDFDVMLGDSIEVRRDGEDPETIAGNCPIDCLNLPCTFTMQEDCDFVGTFE